MLVDLLPKRNALDHVVKLYDYNPSEFNLVLHNIINILEMMPGTIPDYPNLGAKPILMKLTNITDDMDELRKVADELTFHIVKFFMRHISFEIGKRDPISGIVELKILIDDLPGYIKLDIAVTRSYTKIIKPSYVQA